MEDGVANKEINERPLKTANFSIIKLYFYYLLKYNIIFGIIAIAVIIPYLVFANPFIDFIENLELTPNLFIFFFIIIIILGMYAIFTGKTLLKLKKIAFLKVSFYENNIIIEGTIDIFKKYTIRLPYKSITNININKNIDDKILKTAKITIEFKKELGVDGPIQMLGKPIVLENIDNYEEINDFLTNKINNIRNNIKEDKKEENAPKEKEIYSKDSIFYQ